MLIDQVGCVLEALYERFSFFHFLPLCGAVFNSIPKIKDSRYHPDPGLRLRGKFIESFIRSRCPLLRPA
jgi:hypothetical protein